MNQFSVPLTRVFLFVAVTLLASAGSALAQGTGVRAGVSAGPDQFYFGAHAELGPVADQLWFRPNIEAGVGSNRTLIALNFEVAYFFDPLPNSAWRVYVGGGPAANVVRFRDRTSTEGGLNILGGLAHARGFFVELKVGALDSPDLKVGIGYTFR